VDIPVSYPHQDSFAPFFEDPKNGMDQSSRYVCEISDTVIIRKSGLIQTDSGQYIFESVKRTNHLQRTVRKNPVQLFLRLRKTTAELAGRITQNQNYNTVISMVTHTSSNHPYGHWVVEYLPKLLGLSIYEEETGNRPKILINKNPPEWMIESLGIMGYNRDRLIEWDNDVANIKTLIHPLSSTHHRNIEKINFHP